MTIALETLLEYKYCSWCWDFEPDTVETDLWIQATVHYMLTNHRMTLLAKSQKPSTDLSQPSCIWHMDDLDLYKAQ